MKKDIKYIIKRILIGVGIALVLSFIKTNVYAATLLPPDTIQVYNANGQITYYNGSPSVVSWYYENGWTIPNSPQSNIQWSSPRFNFWFNHNNLCAGKVINTNITTLMYSNFPTGYNIDFNNNAFRLKVWNGQTESYCSLLSLSNNNKVAKWSCNFVHYQDTVLFIYPQGISFQYNNSQFGIAIGDSSTYGCSSTDSDIINNQTNNTNSIINNDNNNTTIIVNEQQNTTNAINNVNDSLTDSNINTGGGAGHYFGDNEFKKEYGLSDFVLIPINFIRTINSNTCSNISVPLPFTEQSFTLPCMRAILTDKFPDFISLYQTIISGVIIFKCLVGCYGDIQRAMDPDEKLTVTDMFT